MERQLVTTQGGVRIYQGATPVGGDAHFDVPLSNFASAAFDITDDSFVADRALPVVNVGKQSDKYYQILKHDFNRKVNTLRAPRTAANRITFTVSSDSYFADNYALAAENALEDLANADRAVALRQNSIRLVQRVLRLDQEIRTASLMTTPANVGSSYLAAGADSWFSVQSADIIGQANSAHAFIRGQTGLLPNTAIIDWDSYQMALANTRLFDAFKDSGGAAGFITDAHLARVLKVQNVLVARAIVNNSGTGWDSVNVWGNNCVFAHISPATGLQSMTAAARFRWRPPIFASDFGVLTSQENAAGSKHIEIVEAGMFQDEKIIASDLIYVINTSSGNTGAP